MHLNARLSAVRGIGKHLIFVGLVTLASACLYAACMAQAVLVAGAIPFLWVYARRAIGVRSAYFVALAFSVSWPVVEAVAFDFHEVAFAPVLVAVMIERHQAGRVGQVILAALALMCVKEDMGLLVAGFGMYLLTQRGWRFPGAAFAVCGIFFSWAASQILIPLFGGRADYYWAYGTLGGTVKETAVNVVTDPLSLLEVLTTPREKTVTVALLFGMTLFASFLSPMVVVSFPLLAERMLASAFPNWWAAKYHYNAFIVVIVFAAGIDGVRRIRAIRARATRQDSPGARPPGWRSAASIGCARTFYARWWAPGTLVFGLVCLPFFSLNILADPESYRLGARERAMAEAAAVIPDGAVVEAANNVAPRLSFRSETLLWDREPRWAPWVVADTERKVFPFWDVGEQRERITLLVDEGYRVVFAKEGVCVLRRAPSRNP